MASEGKSWLYYILDSAGRSYYLNNGIVQVSSTPKPLRLTVDGWQDISVGFERNLERLGMNRNFTLPLGYVIEAATILRTLYYTKNFEEKVYILIQKQQLELTDTTYHFWYRYFYKGEIDLSTFNAEQNKVVVNCMEGGIHKDIKANEATVYEIPCDEIFVRMDGIDLAGKHNWQVIELELLSASAGMIPIILLSTEGTPINHSAVTQVGTGGGFFDNTGFILAQFVDSTTFQLTGQVRFRGSDDTTTIIIKLHKIIDDDFNSPTVIQTQTYNVNLTTEQTFSFDETIVLNAGEKIQLTYFTTGNPPASPLGDDIIFTGGEITADFINRKAATNTLAVKPYTLFNRLVERITGDAANAVSDLLNANANLLVTSGDAIRRISGAVIKTSLNDFFTSFSSILCAGMGIINGKIYFERRDYFLNPADVIVLNKAKEVKERPATELMANVLKIGYPNQTYDDVNGRQEYNTTHQYSSPVKRVVKTLELVSIYRADCFGIEYTRINLEGKTTTDNSSDNDVFIVNTNLQSENLEDGSYNLKRETYDTITGVLSPTTVFNIEDLTPARMLKKWEAWLNSIFYGFAGDKLKFETNDKNGLLYTDKAGVIFDEDADVTIGTTPRTFKPLIFEVTPETPEEIVETLEANPNRCFSFVHWNGDIFFGYNIKIGIAANTLEEQQFQLLSTNDNDLNSLAI